MHQPRLLKRPTRLLKRPARRQEFSDLDSPAERHTKSGRETAVASASQKKIQKDTVKPEKFEANAFGTLEEHIASHAYPAHVATCGPCHFWKNRWNWSAEFSYVNPVSQKNETWLGCRNGFAVCLICSAYKGARAITQLGKGLGSFRWKFPFQRHVACREHKLALQAHNERLRAEAVGVEIVSTYAMAPVSALYAPLKLQHFGVFECI